MATFEEALKCMREGKKVKRPDSYYLVLNDNFVVNEVGADELLFTREDLFAEDWEVIDDTQNEGLGITLKDIKNNGLESKNTVEEITPLHSKTNNDDTHNTLKNNENFNISSENVKENNIFYKECCDKFIDYVKKSHNEQTLTGIIYKVPSYEDWQKLHKRLKDTQDLELKVRKENQKLKDLLKRCRDFINYEVPDHCIDDVLIDKIDEVLK